MYVLVTYLQNVLTVLRLVETQTDAENAVRDTAVDWVCDEVGKKNYVNTLNDDKPLTAYPAGYIIKYDTDNKNRINLYHNHCASGWIVSNTVTTTVGYFAVYQVDYKNDNAQIESLQTALANSHTQMALLAENYEKKVDEVRQMYELQLQSQTDCNNVVAQQIYKGYERSLNESQSTIKKLKDQLKDAEVELTETHRSKYTTKTVQPKLVVTGSYDKVLDELKNRVPLLKVAPKTTIPPPPPAPPRYYWKGSNPFGYTFEQRILGSDGFVNPNYKHERVPTVMIYENNVDKSFADFNKELRNLPNRDVADFNKTLCNPPNRDVDIIINKMHNELNKIMPPIIVPDYGKVLPNYAKITETMPNYVEVSETMPNYDKIIVSEDNEYLIKYDEFDFTDSESDYSSDS